jgi:two-component sensor histidine kinase
MSEDAFEAARSGGSTAGRPTSDRELSADPSDESARLASVERELALARAALISANERERLLAFELQHRVRNMLALIRSIHRRTLESGGSQAECAQHFEGRLNAIARYQSIVDDGSAAELELEDILRNELLGTLALDTPQCILSGPPIYLPQASAEMVGLAIHELATNSIKFGALAQHGCLTVTWSVIEGAAGPQLSLCWTETGIATDEVSQRSSGFGRQLIEEALPYQFGAETSFEFGRGGLVCSIILPLPDRGGAGTKRGERHEEAPPLLPPENGDLS